MTDDPETASEDELSYAASEHEPPDKLAELRSYVGWSANVVHQAYHRDSKVGWLECEEAHCREARFALKISRA